MGILKTLWKNLRTRTWMIVTAVLTVLILIIGIATTQIGLIFGTLRLVLGDYRYEQVKDSPKYYESEFDTKEDSVDFTKQVSLQLAEEGIVMLKNDNDTLPIATPQSPANIRVADKPRISVFGKHSVNMVYGGSGSGGRSADKVVKLHSALEEEGFEVNGALKEFYESKVRSGDGRLSGSPKMGETLTGFPISETPWDLYDSTVKQSFTQYSDAAVIVLSRIGGEGFDLPRLMQKQKGGNSNSYSSYYYDSSWSDNPEKIEKVDGAFSKDDHYLQLDENETKLIEEVCDAFSTVVILLNCGTAMEIGSLAENPAIQSVLWVGNPGGNGNTAIARVLSGNVNPSGRLVDTFSRNFKNDPTWANFGNNLVRNGDMYYLNTWGAQAVKDGAYFVRYEEGIYIGYRYYETRGYTEWEQAQDYTWYDDAVVYPFGYGLSYSDFEWTIDWNSLSVPNGTALQADSVITLDVTVKNNGNLAGKDVVQLYYTAEYHTGSVEKAHVVLGDFEKTKLLAKGEEDTVTLTLNASDMASYVYDMDFSSDGFTGYKLERGAYTLQVARNAHQAWADGSAHPSHMGSDSLKINYTVDEDINYTKRPDDNADVVNRFRATSDHIKTNPTGDKSEALAYLTRSDWQGSFPISPVAANRDSSYNIVSGANFGLISGPLSSHRVTSTYDGVWDKEEEKFITTKPWTVHPNDMPDYGQRGNLQLIDLRGVEYDNKLWDQLVSQLTIAEMSELIGIGAFGTVSLGSIGKPPTADFDGPGGFVVGSFMQAAADTTEVCFFPCASLIGSIWNKDLAFMMGEALGEDSLWGAKLAGVDYTFAGWYAPGVNLHRSQFGGRNFEYYSEDGFLSGKIAANVVAGAKSKGVYTFVKHFAVNEQETNRSSNGLVTWLNEQSLREIYIKPFELTVKENERETVNRKGESVTIVEGGTTAMMSSFNRIGTEWAGGSYNLLTEVLRNEWGFKGMVITDYNNGAGSYMDLDKMIRAGGDLNLFQSNWLSTSKSALTATQVTAMQKATKNILYTVVNSNAMNVAVGKRLMPTWQLVMILVFVGIYVCLAVWGFFVICSVFKVLMFKGKSGDTGNEEKVTA